MADPYVGILGEVTDLDDVRVGVGVDYDAITVGQLRFSAGQAEELAQLFVSAVWQAGQQKARMDEEAEPEWDSDDSNVFVAAEEAREAAARSRPAGYIAPLETGEPWRGPAQGDWDESRGDG